MNRREVLIEGILDWVLGRKNKGSTAELASNAVARHGKALEKWEKNIEPKLNRYKYGLRKARTGRGLSMADYLKDKEGE